MGDEEETRVCSRCKKEVAEANFALHESHCRRFLVLCPDCDENVPRSELEAHREEQHAPVRCPKCQKKMEKRLLVEHEEEECPSRRQVCVYCDLDMAWSELKEHTVACGSRTELCPDCGRYVKLSDREEHDKTCSDPDLYNEEPSPTPGAYGPARTATRRTGMGKVKVHCQVCWSLYPVEDIEKHEMRCAAASQWNREESDEESDDDDEKFGGVDFLNPRFRNILPDPPRPNRGASRLRDEPEDSSELSTCPHCQLTLPHTTLRWHEGKCKLHKNLKQREAAARNVF